MIGIIGFGRFSGLMAKYLSKDFEVLISTRKDKRAEINAMGATQASLADVCAKPKVILSVPISAMEEILKKISPLVKDDALVMDVCSVKTYPVNWMKEILPRTVSILATHPMFGPDSAAESLTGRKIVLCRERMDDTAYAAVRAYLEGKGLIVIETSPEEHDRQIATTPSLTHFVGRALEEFGAAPLEIDTEGYKRLLHILGVVKNDTWELFKDMHQYNPYARETRSSFLNAMKKIDAMLDGPQEDLKL